MGPMRFRIRPAAAANGHGGQRQDCRRDQTSPEIGLLVSRRLPNDIYGSPHPYNGVDLFRRLAQKAVPDDRQAKRQQRSPHV